MTSQFYNAMNEINALFNNIEENFDSCFEYCVEIWGKIQGRFYFDAYYNIKNTLPNAIQEHDHILQINGNITTCLDCDLWERKESTQQQKRDKKQKELKEKLGKYSKITNESLDILIELEGLTK